MKPYNLFIILLIAFSMLTCEEKTYNELTGEGTLLKEIAANGEIYFKYTYNEADFVKEEKSKYHYTEHHYNSKNQLIQSDNYWDESITSSNSTVLQEAINRTEWVTPENTEMDSYITFEYNSIGQLKKTTVYNLKDNSSTYSTYTYNNDKILERTSYNDDQQSALEAYYYDQYNNLTKKEKYVFLGDVQPKLSSSTEYFYDGENNPYFSFRALMIPGEHTNKNNIIKQVYTIYSLTDNSVEDVQTTEYSYEYNAKGFPERRDDGFEYTYY